MKWAVACAIVVALTGCGSQGAVSADTLVVITVTELPLTFDDHPALRDLAERGVRFERAFTPAPLARPAAASLLSGLDPLDHGARDPSASLAEDVVLVPAVLRRHGWTTAAFVNSSDVGESSGLLTDFDVWTSPTASQQGRMRSDHWRAPGRAVDDALEWLAETAEVERRFLWVHIDPAHPGFVNGTLARLIDVLATEHANVWTILASLRGQDADGLTLDETQIRVPLILAGPDARVAPDVVRDALVSLTDVAPTLLELAGCSPTALTGACAPSLLAPDADRALVVESQLPVTEHRWHELRHVVPAGAEVEGRHALTDPSDRSADIQRQLDASAALTRGRRLLRLEPDPTGAEHVSGESARERRARGLAALEDARASLDAMAPGSPWVARHIGLVELSRGNVAKAADAFETAANLAPEHAATRHQLGGCYAQLGHDKWAVAEMAKALELDETFALAYEWLVAQHVRNGDGASASWWLERYADTFPARDDLRHRSAQLIAAGSTPSAAPPAEAQRVAQERASSPDRWLVPERIRASSPSGQDR